MDPRDKLVPEVTYRKLHVPGPGREGRNPPEDETVRMVRYAREIALDLPERVFRPLRLYGQNPEAWLTEVELYMMGVGVPEH